MIRALRTGNYGIIVGWLVEELTEDEHAELVKAADEGNAMGSIMRSVRAQTLAGKQHSGLKIHSNLYHWVKLGFILEFFFISQSVFEL